MENYNPDKLLAGDYPMVTDIVTILTGQNLVRGTLLGKVTATGKYIKCDSAAVDGSQSPQAILSEACDASAADKQAVVFLSGAFNQGAVTFGGADTAATHRSALRDLNIYLKSAV
ncbi:MAG: hypothetical protein A2Y38_24955 [Spirochaetes bacterium GWB1_59_5]|nr:MAG: hypothetical protein A2Y38_24955 [Spirochaetes bacterium GWB1_59_5]